MDVGSNGGGTVRVDQDTPSSYPATSTIREGTSVELEAVPDPGYRFDNWSGDLTDTATSTSIVIDCSKKITANFSQVMHTLTIQVSGSGSTDPMVGKSDYANGTVVSITATPNSGWRFDRWTGDVSDPHSAATTVTLDSYRNVTANFSQAMPIQVIVGIAGGLVLAGSLVVVSIVRRKVH